ncbi:DUF933 domain-containing protein [Streptomyces gardneri]|nr:DUF933 domain-containing protein [Streptomyces gardneri]
MSPRMAPTTSGPAAYLAAGLKTLAWTIHQGDTVPKAAGVIRTDLDGSAAWADVRPQRPCAGAATNSTKWRARRRSSRPGREGWSAFCRCIRGPVESFRSQHIAHRGACCKARVMPQNHRPKLEPAEIGVASDGYRCDHRGRRTDRSDAGG